MTTAKSFFNCWITSDKTDELNELRTELEQTRTKYEEARKEIRKLKFENITLLNKNLSLSPSLNANPDPTLSPHVTRPIPSFEYSSNTMVVHPEFTAKQEKAEEKVMEKILKRKNILQYETLALSDTEEYEDSPRRSHDVEYEKHKAKVNELMKQISTLSKVIQETEKDKDRMVHIKDQEIASLQKEIQELKMINDKIKQQTDTPTLTKRISFSLSLNQDINEMVNDNDSVRSTTSSKYSKSGKTHYDHTKEQIDILNHAQYKNKSLTLCKEQLSINKSGKDEGLVLFFEKYLKTKTLDQIFTKSGMATKSDTNRISNASGLVNVLSFVVILYKVKVFQTEKGNQRKPEINNADIKDSVKYLAIWIVRTYGEKTKNKYYHNKRQKEYDIYNFKMSKEEFGKNVPRYLEQFAREEGKHSDSDL